MYKKIITAANEMDASLPLTWLSKCKMWVNRTTCVATRTFWFSYKLYALVKIWLGNSIEGMVTGKQEFWLPFSIEPNFANLKQFPSPQEDVSQI